MDIFHRYFNQIEQIAEHCEKLYIIYIHGEPIKRWMENITFIKVDIKNYFSQKLSYYLNVGSVYNQIKNVDFDLCFCLSSPSFQHYMNYIADKKGVPFIISMRGNDIEVRRLQGQNTLLRKFYEHINIRTFRNADCVIPIAIKQIPVLLSWGVERYRISEPIYNGINGCLFDPIDKNIDYVIGYAGRLSKEKGTDFLLELMNRMTDYKFVIAGDNQVDMKFPSNCNYIGNINYDDMPSKFFSNCRVIILPSYTEGFPNVFLEAYSMEKIVICSPDALPSELKLFGFKEELDIDLWVDLIKRLKFYGSEMKDLGSDAREYVLYNFPWQRTGDSFIEVFKSVLEKER